MPLIEFRVGVENGPNLPVPRVDHVPEGALVTVPLKETTALLAHTTGVTPAEATGNEL